MKSQQLAPTRVSFGDLPQTASAFPVATNGLMIECYRTYMSPYILITLEGTQSQLLAGTGWIGRLGQYE
jgi:hypothetical protein